MSARTLVLAVGLCLGLVVADAVNCFKNRLDNFWSNQVVLYDYKADLHGIGNRSI